MLRVGITGGIGSGKSTVCRLFSMLGIPAYDSDARAKGLMESDSHLVEQIVALFGYESYLPDREHPRLNRAHIARRVFGGGNCDGNGAETMLAELNSLVHPVVMDDFDLWVQNIGAQINPPPYIIIESAILFESGLVAHVDRTIRVDASSETRAERIMIRDNVGIETVERRMAAQRTAGSAADRYIDNSGETLVWPQVLAIDNELRHNAVG